MTSALAHTLFTALFGSLLALRLYFHVRARTWQREGMKPEGPGIVLLRLFFGLPMIGLALAYMVRPSLFPWMVVPVPGAARWAGFALGVLGLTLGAWVHVHLDSNFSSELRIRSDHQLVTTGPYHWVRHPMYTAFVICMAGLFLLSGNWFIGGSGLLILTVVMIVRTPREERMLVERFGEQYRAYAAKTGRYLPRF